MFKMSRIRSQNIRMQKQSKMRLLRAKSQIEALFSQTSAKYVKMRNVSRRSQNFRLSISQTTNRKKKFKKVTKNKSIYHVIRERNTLNAISILIQLKITIEFNFTTINDLKRKKTQKRLSKKNREHDVVATSTKIILNRLIKKHKSNKQLNSIRETTNSFNNDVSTSITSTSFSIDDLNILEKIDVSQTRKNTQNEKNDIWCLDEMSSKYYNTTFTNQKIK